LLLTPVTVNVTCRLLLKLVPRVPAETFMIGGGEGMGVDYFSSRG
jgi:hypothetical protein